LNETVPEGGGQKMKLSKNEKIILWGLVKFPMLNDRQLSDKIGVRMSTLNAIKNKMKRMDLIFDRIVPNVEIMDYEILSVNWTQLSRPIKKKDDINFLKNLFSDHPNTYTAMVFGDTLFFLSLYKNFTHHKISESQILSGLKSRSLYVENRWHSTLYPLKISALRKNFDYTAVLERAFSIKPDHKNDIELDDKKLKKGREKIYHLSKKEKTILKGILEAPDLPDNKIASNLDTTRQAVARHKKELLDLGVIKKTRVIDYGKLGFNILCLVEASYDKKEGVKNMGPNVGTLHLPSFFAVYGGAETVSLSLFKDFNQFTGSREEYTEALKEFCIFRKEPSINLFSPSNTITIKHQEYLPLIEEFLEEN
jgi:DNA-binding Lrp family transcriptional regulator